MLIIPDPHAATIVPLKVDQNERSFIPVFSNAATFDKEAYGTGFEREAIAEASFLASLLKSNDLVTLNSGTGPPSSFMLLNCKRSSIRQRCQRRGIVLDASDLHHADPGYDTKYGRWFSTLL